MVKRQRSPCFIRGLGRIAFLITRFTCDQKAGSLSRKILQRSFFSKLQRCQKTCGRLQYIAIGFGSLACEALFFTSGSYLNSSVSISMGSLKKKGVKLSWNSVPPLPHLLIWFRPRKRGVIGIHEGLDSDINPSITMMNLINALSLLNGPSVALLNQGLVEGRSIKMWEWGYKQSLTIM